MRFRSLLAQSLLASSLGLCAYSGGAQPLVNGIAGFEFGPTRGEVSTRMMQTSGVSLLRQGGDTLEFAGGKYFGCPVDRWNAVFGKAGLVALRIQVGGDSLRPFYYKTIMARLTAAYGKCHRTDRIGLRLESGWFWQNLTGDVTLTCSIDDSHDVEVVCLLKPRPQTRGKNIKR